MHIHSNSKMSHLLMRITARTLYQLLLDGWNQRPDPSGDGRVE
jgi:hypothetical protein